MEEPKESATYEPRGTNPPWPVRDILLGLGLLVVLALFQRLSFAGLGPQRAQLYQFAVVVLSLSSLILYALFQCKKGRLWPVFERTALRKLAKEFVVSSWYMFLILLVCGALLFIPALILKPGMGRPEALGDIGTASNSGVFIALLVTAITVGPLAEELFFRGFLYNALKSRLSVAWAGGLQSLAFAAFHQYDLFNSLRIFLFGIAFVIIYERRKTLLAPVSAHVFVNLVATLPLLVVTVFDIRPPI
ncbi:MAG: type II CAAX endopeptidase family protein [Nitrospirota bacterium]|jgi:membrane protease YdiL (CAAX protease family)